MSPFWPDKISAEILNVPFLAYGSLVFGVVFGKGGGA